MTSVTAEHTQNRSQRSTNKHTFTFANTVHRQGTVVVQPCAQQVESWQIRVELAAKGHAFDQISILGTLPVQTGKYTNVN